MVGRERDGLELELRQGDQRDRLLAALGHLVRRRGFETFVSAPILLPRSDYFPERWERTVPGARRLLRRLMHYAGLGQLRVELASWRERPGTAGGLDPRHTEGHAVAWFAGIRDGTCEFGLELEQLRHEESLVATLAHEVAHAYREHHGLVITDRDLEEKLTDLTCVYLGFGMFTLNASHVIESGGVSPSGEPLLYQTRSLGYLSPPELALLLAAQLAVRGDAEEQRAARAELLPNHAALVERGLRELAGTVAALRQGLHVPEPSSWPPRIGVEGIAELPDDDEPETQPHHEASAEPTGDAIAFRVKQDRASGFLLLLLVLSAVSGFAVGAEGIVFYAMCAAGAAGGLLIGRRVRVDECSSCRARLALNDGHCQQCQACLVGEIASRDQRLEAEEDYRGKHAVADPDGDGEDEDPLAVLFTAMLAAWGMNRNLLVEDAGETENQLAARVREGDFDTEALYSAWMSNSLLTEEGMRFAEYYCSEPTGLRTRDFVTLGTANRLDDRPSNYARFAAILDCRFPRLEKHASEGAETLQSGLERQTALPEPSPAVVQSRRRAQRRIFWGRTRRRVPVVKHSVCLRDR